MRDQLPGEEGILGSQRLSAGHARKDRARRDVVLPLSEPVTAALQSYAARGVFRGFRATALPRGRIEYAFQWMWRRTLHARYDTRTRTLAFPALFPRIDPDTNIAPLLKSLVHDRSAGGRVPRHKQLDKRRARLSSTLRGRDFSLAVSARGDNHAYAVRFALNLINDLFVELQTYFPEYLAEEFGMSTE